MSADHEIDSAAISALKALIGRNPAALYGREVHAEPLRGSASCPKGVLWLGSESPDFVTIEPVLKSSPGDQDYQLLDIRRADTPLELPYNKRTGAVGPCSLIELAMPGVALASIDVVRMTATLDDDTVTYDHALTFRFEDGGVVTVGTEHDSMLEALVVRQGEARAGDPEFETLDIRMTLK